MRTVFKRTIALILIAAMLFSLCCEAFADTLTLPSSLQEIAEEAFCGDDSLDEVAIPYGTETIADRAFADSGVSRVHIPETVNQIADDAFEDAENTVIVSSSTAPARDYAFEHGIPWENADPDPLPDEEEIANNILDYLNDDGLFARQETEWIELPEIPALGAEYAAFVTSFNRIQQEEIDNARAYNDVVDQMKEAYTKYENNFSTFSLEPTNSGYTFDTGSFQMDIEEDVLRSLDRTCTVESAKLCGETMCYTARDEAGEVFYLNITGRNLGISRQPAVEGPVTGEVPPAPDDGFGTESDSALNEMLDIFDRARRLVTDLDTLTGEYFVQVSEHLMICAQNDYAELREDLRWLRKVKKRVTDEGTLQWITEAQKRTLRKCSRLQQGMNIAAKGGRIARGTSVVCQFALSPVGDIYSIYNARTRNEKLYNLKKHGHPRSGEYYDEMFEIVQEMNDRIEWSLWISRAEIGSSIISVAATCYFGLQKWCHAAGDRGLNKFLNNTQKVQAGYDIGTLVHDNAQALADRAFAIDEMLHYELGGVVTDKETRKPLGIVEITCEAVGHEPIEVLSDTDSTFLLRPLSPDVTVIVHEPGYEDLPLKLPSDGDALTYDNKVFKSFQMERLKRGVYGRVIDAETGAAISDAEVTVITAEGNYTTITDGNGRYSFRDLPVGKQTITFSAVFYISPQPGSILIEENACKVYDARLTPTNEPNDDWQGSGQSGGGAGPNFWQWCTERYDHAHTVYEGGQSRWVTTDGKLDRDECLDIIRIWCDIGDFTSLAGIGAFQNLNVLTCTGNRLTSLHLSLPKLSYLNCGGNLLQSLSLSGCGRMEKLECQNNQLTNLNVSGFRSLVYLDCQSNLLKNLNLSGCTSLEYLYFSRNPTLESLNVSGCTLLTNLPCFNLQLTNLNVSGCTGLEKISCSNNRLTRLDLSGLTELKSLSCDNNRFSSLSFSGLPELTSLDCSNNSLLTSLNVSGLTALESLNCCKSRLTSLNVSGLSTLKTLDCRSNQLTTLNCAGCTGLETLYFDDASTLESLNLSGCTGLTSLDLTDCTVLTSIDLSGCTGLTSLVIRGCTALKSLNLTGCAALSSIMYEENGLTSLDLSGFTALKYLTCADSGLKALSLYGCSSLGTLNVSGSPVLRALDCSGCVNLGGLDFETNPELMWLDVSGCANLRRLSFKNAPVLASLNLSGCNALSSLSADDCALTSLNLTDCSALTKLSCKSNRLTRLNLNRNPELSILYCDDNQLTTLNLADHTKLETLTCADNQIKILDCSGCALLATLDDKDNPIERANFSGCTALTFFDLQNSVKELNLTGCTGISNLNFENLKLTTLNVSGCTNLNGLNCTGNQLTTLNVSGCTRLNNLFCAGNRLTALNLADCAALENLYCANNQLTSLNVSGCVRLNSLGCSDNRLAALDLSGCTGLANLYCDNNQLSLLNLTGCAMLNSLNCTGNQLTSLDLSGKTKLTELYCDSNQLTTLNLSGCSGLQKMFCIGNQLEELNLTGCTVLKEMNCGSNRLTSLNLNGLIALENLACPDNQLTSLDCSGCTSLHNHYYVNNPQLRTVNFSDCTSLSFFDLQDCVSDLNLSGCTSLSGLNFDNHNLESLDLSGCTGVTGLSCVGNKLKSLDLSGCTGLPYFDCSNNQLTSLNLTGCTALTGFTCTGNRLKTIDVSTCPSVNANWINRDPGVTVVGANAA